MARREAENLIGRLRQMSEEGAASFFSELMASETLRKRLGKAGEQFLNNKQSFDRNVETVLDFVNIPSKRDVRELKARLDYLNSQIVNLSMKIDRMLASSEATGGDDAPAKVSRARRKRPPKTTDPG